MPDLLTNERLADIRENWPLDGLTRWANNDVLALLSHIDAQRAVLAVQEADIRRLSAHCEWAAGREEERDAEIESLRALLERERAPRSIEIRLNEDGSLDEIVGDGRFMIEQMDDGLWFLDLGGVALDLSARGSVRAMPRDYTTWADAAEALSDTPPPADAALLASANRELMAQVERMRAVLAAEQGREGLPGWEWDGCAWYRDFGRYVAHVERGERGWELIVVDHEGDGLAPPAGRTSHDTALEAKEAADTALRGES